MSCPISLSHTHNRFGMHPAERSNTLAIACLLGFFTVLYVPTPVRSQHPYGLISAIVDGENSNDGQDVFTLDTYAMIEFAYVDDGISQIWALRRDGTEKIARFRSPDYHTMISNVVVFDTGDPNRTVKCQFKDKDDVKEFYGFLRPNSRPFHKIKYGIISVLQYDCINADCGNGTCDDRSCGDKYYDVSAKGTVYVETLTRAADSRPLMKRFVIRDDDGTTNMVFTSKSFNMTPIGENEYMMISVRIEYFLFRILIQFKDNCTARRFGAYVFKNQDVDRNIPLNIPNLWRDFV